MDQLVHGCLGTSDAGCSYALQRCTDSGPCGECVANMNNGNNARAVAQSLASPSCTAALNALDFPDTLYMVDFTCSQVGSCLSAVTAYVQSYHGQAIACINGSNDSFCITGKTQQFGIESACKPCPSSVHEINAIVFVTAVVGGASAVVCLLVVGTIIAYVTN